MDYFSIFCVQRRFVTDILKNFKESLHTEKNAQKRHIYDVLCNFSLHKFSLKFNSNFHFPNTTAYEWVNILLANNMTNV